jgi:hypothetical protein
VCVACTWQGTCNLQCVLRVRGREHVNCNVCCVYVAGTMYLAMCGACTWHGT